MNTKLALLLTTLTAAVIAGEIEINQQARYSGFYGMQVTLDNGLTSCVRDNSPVTESRYRARFYMKLNDVQMEAGDELDLFTGNDDDDRNYFRIYLKAHTDGLRLYAQVFNFGFTTATTPRSETVLLDEDYHMIECEWSSAVNPGYFNLWVDGKLQSTLDNLNIAGARIHYVLLGAAYFLEGQSATGKIYLDDFKSGRTDYIGPLDCNPIYLITKDLPAWPLERNILEQLQIYATACYQQQGGPGP